MANTATLPTVDALSEVISDKFRPGLLALAARAGWQPADLPGIAWLAAHDALDKYDESQGALIARGWHFCQRQAWSAGFLPAGDDAGMALANTAGGDDPVEILAAAELAARLDAIGIGRAAGRGAARSRRRHAAQLRGAAADFAAGGEAGQGELF